MADMNHLRILRKGVKAWNAWRADNPAVRPDLSEILIKSWIDKGYGVDTTSGWARPRGDFSRVVFSGTRFDSCRMTGSDFSASTLSGAILDDCDLRGCDFTDSVWSKTILVNCDLAGSVGLEKTVHRAPSVLDHRTLLRNPRLNLHFLRGVGLSDSLIEYLPSLTSQPIDFYSCFISYSSMDNDFTKRIHADLQDSGVRCWYAPEDLKIGARMRDAIDRAIRVRDKLLLVLSRNAIGSSWVEKEVETAFEEERRAQRPVLFPVMIDDAVFEAATAWAADIRRTRHIGDFRAWTDVDAYTSAFARLLRDLRQDGDRTVR